MSGDFTSSQCGVDSERVQRAAAAAAAAGVTHGDTWYRYRPTRDEITILLRSEPGSVLTSQDHK